MRAVAFTHGEPTDPTMCGRPVTSRFDPDDPVRVTGWRCLLHGDVDEVVGTAILQPNTGMFGVNPPVDDEVRGIFRELREGMRTVVEELRQEAFPPTMMSRADMAQASGANAEDALLLAMNFGNADFNAGDAGRARIERLQSATLRCPMLSSVTDEQCMLDAGHPEWRPTRFHKFSRPEFPATGSAESEPDVTFRKRRAE